VLQTKLRILLSLEQSKEIEFVFFFDEKGWGGGGGRGGKNIDWQNLWRGKRVHLTALWGTARAQISSHDLKGKSHRISLIIYYTVYHHLPLPVWQTILAKKRQY
jgi:hypothetical protein